jgi:hypothetical protein
MASGLGANPGTHKGFTLAEDAALKYRLGSLAVSDDKDGQRVCKVFYRHPDGETEKVYPFITIELLDIAHATDRQASEVNYYYSEVPGFTSNINYFPSEMNAADMSLQANGGVLVTDQFVPVNLMYQVTTHARSQRHDRQLTALLLRRVFPFRRGFITIPEDGTIRRCDIVSWRSNDILDQETGYKNRIFRKMYTVTINAEIPQSDLFGGTYVQSVEGEINRLPDSVLVNTWQNATDDLTYPSDSHIMPSDLFEGP